MAFLLGQKLNNPQPPSQPFMPGYALLPTLVLNKTNTLDISILATVQCFVLCEFPIV